VCLASHIQNKANYSIEHSSSRRVTKAISTTQLPTVIVIEGISCLTIRQTKLFPAPAIYLNGNMETAAPAAVTATQKDCPPDFLKPNDINIGDFFQRAFRGFCVPSPKDEGMESSSGSSSAVRGVLAAADTPLYRSTAAGGAADFPKTVARAAAAAHNNEGEVESDIADNSKFNTSQSRGSSNDDDDDDDYVLIETVSGTKRIVRVQRALELFLFAVTVLFLTLVTLKNIGVHTSFDFEFRPKWSVTITTDDGSPFTPKSSSRRYARSGNNLYVNLFFLRSTQTHSFAPTWKIHTHSHNRG
jgi:hypothetical protein